MEKKKKCRYSYTKLILPRGWVAELVHHGAYREGGIAPAFATSPQDDSGDSSKVVEREEAASTVS